MNFQLSDVQYYYLLLVDEFRNKYNDIQTVFDFLSGFKKLELEHKRVWLNIWNNDFLVNSFFEDYNDIKAIWNIFIVRDYYFKGYYSKIFIVNCMHIRYYIPWRINEDNRSAALLYEDNKLHEFEAIDSDFGKQYNIFGGFD